MNLRQRAGRRTFGALWMTLYGAAASSVVWWATWPAPAQLGIWLGVVIGLNLVIALRLRRLRSLDLPASRRRPFDPVLARSIGLVILVYSIGESVAAIVLHLLSHDALIFPIAVAIAGIHASMVGLLPSWTFFPLAGGGVALFVTAGLMLYESRAISFEGVKSVSRT